MIHVKAIGSARRMMGASNRDAFGSIGQA